MTFRTYMGIGLYVTAARAIEMLAEESSSDMAEDLSDALEDACDVANIQRPISRRLFKKAVVAAATPLTALIWPLQVAWDIANLIDEKDAPESLIIEDHGFAVPNTEPPHVRVDIK